METKRKIKIWVFTSLDGIASRFNGDTDFISDYPNPSKEEYGFKEFYNTISCALMNRAEYINLQSNEQWPVKDKPCYVVTNGGFTVPKEHDIRLMLTNGRGEQAFIEQLRELQKKPGGDIWLLGDSEMISLLLEHKMIDKITINTLPITLGSGIELFSQTGATACWELLDCKRYLNGVLQTKYRVKTMFHKTP